MTERNTTPITADEARRAYYRAWRTANRDKIREYNERYWQRKAEQLEREANGDKEDA